jgi:K(+)-stimulated pyrophosphate-energized sodium pump
METKTSDCCKKDASKASTCDYTKCANMSPEQCKAYCDSIGCSAQDREKCMASCKAMKESSNKATCSKNCSMACLTKEECEKKCGATCASSH